MKKLRNKIFLVRLQDSGLLIDTPGVDSTFLSGQGSQELLQIPHPQKNCLSHCQHWSLKIEFKYLIINKLAMITYKKMVVMNYKIYI